MLAAVNSFLRAAGREDCVVKFFKVQSTAFRARDREMTREEYIRLVEAAKVLKSKVSPHNLRHLFALTYYKVERDICHLADLLGHSNINTTRIYTMVSCEEQEQQIDCLGLFIGT